MKKIGTILILSLLMIACKASKKAISNEQNKAIKAEINTTLNNWHLAATEANFDNYFGKMDSISVFIGTDASENWNKTQFANFSKPYFDKGKAWDFKTLERNVYVNKSGDFVWFDELLHTWMGTCRGSGVLEKKANGWKIKQYVLSVAIPNDDVQKVIAAKKKNDSIFLKKFN
tara:strand:- start:27055 stop:27573 length:519 start_codon:yes stop_codon:yes gene_type:complete